MQETRGDAMRHMLLVAICAFLGVGYGFAAEEAPYEIEVGGKTYPLHAGESVEVVTPGGETVPVRLLRRNRYSKHGIAFRFPSVFRLTEEIQFRIPTLVLESNTSALAMIQIYPDDAKKRDEIHTLLVKGIQAQFLSRQAMFHEQSGSEVEAVIAGDVRAGTRLLLDLAGQTIQTRIFTFPLGNRIVAVILQHDMEEERLSEPLFQPILQSLQDVPAE